MVSDVGVPLSFVSDLESLIGFMKRLLAERQRFWVLSVNFRDILGNGHGKGAFLESLSEPHSRPYERAVAESLAAHTGIGGVCFVLGPWELMFIPDAPLDPQEKRAMILRLKEYFKSSSFLEPLRIMDSTTIKGDVRVGVLEAVINHELSLDYQVLRIFQDLSSPRLNDAGRDEHKVHKTSYKVESCIQEIIDKGLLSTRFQPIYSLKTSELFGYECLSFPTTPVPFLNIIQLINSAKEINMLTLLEEAMRERAFFNASRMRVQKRLFVNIDPEVILDSTREIGFTKRLAQRYGLSYDQLVLEITENIRLSTLKSVLKTLAHYKHQGFVVAIDDVGAGISLAPILTAEAPDILKIDRCLVQGCDKSYTKIRILRSLVDLAHTLGILVVAEGIETSGELEELLKLGVDYGQGYLLGRPNESLASFKEFSREISRLKDKPEVGRPASTGTGIGEIARYIEPITPETKVREVDRRFKKDESLCALPVVTPEGIPKGLVVRESFFRQLSRKFGYDLYGEKPIERLMDSNPVIVEKAESLERISRACLERPPFKVYDPFIVVESGKYSGLGTVYELFKKTSELQILYATYANPLTGLPGNIPIYDEINRRILAGLDHVVVYADLDNFKAYNDRYGFPYGDDVIKYTALTLKGVLDPIEGSFSGHVGGDDFVFIVPKALAEPVCKEVLSRFDSSIANFYNEEDRGRGFIVSQDREGQVREFPLIALSMAGILLEPGKFKSYLEVGEEAARLKKIAKKSSQSCFVASWLESVL